MKACSEELVHIAQSMGGTCTGAAGDGEGGEAWGWGGGLEGWGTGVACSGSQPIAAVTLRVVRQAGRVHPVPNRAY